MNPGFVIEDFRLAPSLGDDGARRVAEVEDEALVGLAEPVAVDQHRDGLTSLARGKIELARHGHVITGGAGGTAVGGRVMDGGAPAGTRPGYGEDGLGGSIVPFSDRQVVDREPRRLGA